MKLMHFMVNALKSITRPLLHVQQRLEKLVVTIRPDTSIPAFILCLILLVFVPLVLCDLLRPFLSDLRPEICTSGVLSSS